MHDLTLESLGKGAAIELFQTELQKVLDNIVDPNTPATAKRTVRLDLTIKPDEDREWAAVTLQAKCGLAPNEAFTTKLILGKRAGKGVAEEYAPKQMTLDEGKVVNIKAKEGE